MSVRPSVRLSVRNKQLGSHWADFDEIWYLRFFFRQSVEKIKVSLKYNKNKGYFTWRRFTLVILSRWYLLRLRNDSNKTCRGNQNTHFMLRYFFRKSCRLWDNVEKDGGATEDAENMAPARGILDKQAYTRASTRPRSVPTHTHPDTHTHILTLTHALRTHTHTHTH